jgi:ribonuclease D
LAKVCEKLFKLKLCKHEQMSNWERRPLRYSQEHYGALDAWILTRVINELYHVASKGGKAVDRGNKIFRECTNTITTGKLLTK